MGFNIVKDLLGMGQPNPTLLLKGCILCGLFPMMQLAVNVRSILVYFVKCGIIGLRNQNVFTLTLLAEIGCGSTSIYL
jgi:hypothetical protein